MSISWILGGRIEAGKQTRELVCLDARQYHREMRSREGAVRALGVAAKLLNRVVAAAKQEHVIVGGRLEADMGPQVVHVRTLAGVRTG
jgi:hypothetical protein